MQNEQNILDCIIVGSGPSGFTAAIYAARADMKPELYTGMQPGGQLTTTTEVDNFPGYPKGVTGPDMMKDLQEQAERFDTKVHYEMITKADFATEIGGIHKLYAGNKEILAKTVIISTGATAKYLGLEAEKKYAGGGVSGREWGGRWGNSCGHGEWALVRWRHPVAEWALQRRRVQREERRPA